MPPSISIIIKLSGCPYAVDDAAPARRVIAQERLETQSAVLGVLLGVAEQKKLKTGAVGYGQLTDFFLPNKPVSVTIVPVDYHVPGICELRISMIP